MTYKATAKDKRSNKLLYLLFLYHIFYQYQYVNSLYWDKWNWLPITDSDAADINQVIIMLVSVMLILQFFTKQRFFMTQSKNIILLVVLFFFVIFLASINSDLMNYSFQSFFRLTKFLIYFLCIILIVQSRTDLKRFIKFIVWLNLTVSFIAIPYLLSLYQEDIIVQMIGVLSYSILLYWIFYKNEKNLTLRVLLGAGIVISSLSIFLSGSRRFLLQLLIYIAAIFKKGRVLNPKKLAMAFLLLLLMVFYYQQVVPEDTQERIRHTIDPESEFQLWTGRNYLWKASIMSLQGRWVLGNGVDVVKERMGYLIDKAGLGVTSIEKTRVHNTYLKILADTGILGLSVYLSILLYSIIITQRARRCWLQLNDKYLADISYAYLWIWLSLLAISFFGWSGPYDKIFWTYLGLFAANYAIAQKEISYAKE